MNNLSGKTILILGLGLIGGSIARGLKAADSRQRVLAADLDEKSLRSAIEDKSIDGYGDLESLCPQADIIVIALPPLAINAVLPIICAHMDAGAVVTDVASVKSHILKTLDTLDEGFQQRFVPGHPIAGSERSGYGASQPDLFAQRNVILTPLPTTSPEAVAVVNCLWRQLGANLLGMSICRHDEVLAATSHLPHLLAFAIVDVLVKQELSADIFRYAAGGFADFSRLASSDATMWSDIFIANADASTRVLDAYIKNLVELKKAISDSDQAYLMATFSRAKKTRDKFIEQHFKPSGGTIMTDPQMTLEVQAGGQIAGTLRVPGDKSISHRAIILGSIADGVTEVSGFLEGEDALNTVAAFREMGVTIIGPELGKLTLYGVGKTGLQAPRKPLYMGNSGTAMRLLTGLLAAQSFDSELIGDESLNGRPMNRVVKPLRQMGASIATAAGGTPPLRITGTELRGIEYDMPLASAQVKSCLLLAGLFAAGVTEVREPASCRDHTERMLAGFGYPLQRDNAAGTISVEGGHSLKATAIDVPADISSAAFFIVAAAISPGSSLLLEHVGVNPTRTGIINILQAMGADIELHNERQVGGEPVADLRVRYRPLRGIEIPTQQIALAIDEFPVLFIAAACAEGETLLRGAAELRVKESDRIDAMAAGLTSLGITTESYDDGIRIQGGSLSGGRVDSHGDHRIAMAFTIAALRASGTITITDCA
ncbi:MAG: bifunctional prephenate dehydrogenase/3-phosphoshikimate 1-carboxyvinyltransferase, partial [Proteobacteria bacterium]|nr:bifunctional prephenate dehydrogenase/3-phosphoshikimate 1-carboxyvinyltransferase [Pseudomonadota bacterium]